ncbi:MAG: type II secretion system protein [Candidatus Brocadiia bacterium]
MFQPRSRRGKVGFTLVEVLAATSLMSSLHSRSSFTYPINKAHEIRGLNKLRQIYTLIQVQSLTGGLPKAAFYPKGDPLKDPKSIVNQLKGAPKELFVSPFAPPELQKKGLTYAWNDAVNGKSPDALPRGTWLLIDLTAFIADPDVPKPPKYLVLYANGRAAAVANLPADIQKAVRQARHKLGEED